MQYQLQKAAAKNICFSTEQYIETGVFFYSNVLFHMSEKCKVFLYDSSFSNAENIRSYKVFSC